VTYCLPQGDAFSHCPSAGNPFFRAPPSFLDAQPWLLSLCPPLPLASAATFRTPALFACRCVSLPRISGESVECVLSIRCRNAAYRPRSQDRMADPLSFRFLTGSHCQRGGSPPVPENRGYGQGAHASLRDDRRGVFPARVIGNKKTLSPVRHQCPTTFCPDRRSPPPPNRRFASLASAAFAALSTASSPSILASVVTVPPWRYVPCPPRAPKPPRTQRS
jgi:hypothetical protein